MTDEFIQYTREHIFPSTTGNSFRAWGVDDRSNLEVEPTGITFHWHDSWSNVAPGGRYERPRLSKIESLYTVAERVDIPLIWIGEQNVNYREASGSVEIGEISHNGGYNYETDLERVDIDDLAEKIQDLLGTSYDSAGASKETNLTSNSFRDYTSTYLPQDYTIIDFDVFVEESHGEPFSMTELKRTRSSPRSWSPYSDDWNNYYLQIKICENADMEPLLINHEKQFIEGDYEVGFYYNLERPSDPNVSSHRDFLDYELEYITAHEARRRLREADLDF